jgi:methyl coenzyme M reductase subunit C-like uncharacterized protein (methanogenesis marker protein 7)
MKLYSIRIARIQGRTYSDVRTDYLRVLIEEIDIVWYIVHSFHREDFAEISTLKP